MTTNIRSEQTTVDPEAPEIPPLPPIEPKPKPGTVEPDGGWEPNSPPKD